MFLLALLSTAFGGDFDYQGTAMTLHAPGVGSVWALDVGIIAAGTGVYIIADGAEPRSRPRSDPSGLDGLDPHYNPGLDIPSDFFGHPLKFHSETAFVNGPVLAALGGGVAGTLAGNDVRSGLADFLIVGEAISLGGGSATVLKNVFGRPRPFTSTAFRESHPKDWASEDIQERYTEEGDYDAWKSFPSGHTTGAGTAYFSLATLVWLHSSPSGELNATFWIAESTALALTTTAGVMRVGYGVHHPTDVIAGGILGGSIGVGTVLLHRKLEPNSTGARLTPTPNGMAVAGRF